MLTGSTYTYPGDGAVHAVWQRIEDAAKGVFYFGTFYEVYGI